MLYSVMAKKLSGSDQSRDDKESKLDVGNPNHNNAPPSEITVEFEADSNVYYKETTVDSYEDNSSNHRLNSFLSRFLRIPLEILGISLEVFLWNFHSRQFQLYNSVL